MDKKTWLFIAIGAIIGLVIVLLFFKKSYCFYAYQPGGAVIFAGVAGIASLLGFLVKSLNDHNIDLFKGKEKTIFMVISLLFTGAVVILVSPLFYQLDKNSCVSDFEVLVNLVEQEGKAVLNKDMSIIRDLYTPGAVVTRGDTGESWQVYTYYSIKFAQEDQCTNSHGHYEVTSIASDEVTMTTSSQGTWGQAGKGCTQSFDNQSGSDEWTFEKIGSKWKIVNFEFNKK